MACASDLRCESPSATVGRVTRKLLEHTPAIAGILFLPFWLYLRFSPNMDTKAFVRRLGPDPHVGGAQTVALNGCPDIFELENGDFAVIGLDITQCSAQLPASASCGPDERMVRIPRKTLVLAKRDIPDVP